ncbi:DUF4142 domain-containing protein [Spirosoma taeanense]|uniref:DUF4142 domain-containing protein n=1 Tax=Spirosoma taeanense TaxID=2735870 RepID=A0A6M5Y7J6_9BACT|nr:DUF4142 domain-containing protein [Spirosoma taeanense]QJW90338.1 DUF4142 domain-containing protein [Spirosoma taeanense]
MKSYLKHFYVIGFCLFFSCQNDITEQDRMFLNIAGSAGIMEVEMGKLAQQKGVRTDVKRYGDQMVDEHTNVNSEFRELIKRLKVEVPETMNERNQQMVQEMATLEGPRFDEKYIETMISDHKLAVEKFQEAHDIAQNKEYKDWLSRMIPVVDHHLKMAQELKNKKNRSALHLP